MISALANVGAKNPKAVKALLDLEKISLDGENLIGLSDQVKILEESDPYLFDNDSKLSGYESKSGNGHAVSNLIKDNPFKKETWNLTKQGQLLRENPELYNKLKSASRQ